MTKAKEFVSENIKKISEYNMQNVGNVDQKGSCNELHSERILKIKGTKTVARSAQSLNAVTHSSTI